MSKALKHAIRGLICKLRYLGRQIEIGHAPRISWRSSLQIRGGGRIKVGRNFQIMDYAIIQSCGGNIEIGDDCSVNPFCILYGHGGLRIGSGVRIAAHTVMIPANHTFAELDKPIWRQPETRVGIAIADDVWIGAGCRILDGVKIGRGCVIGAGAVVTKSLPEYSIAVGVPARIIGNRKVKSNQVG